MSQMVISGIEIEVIKKDIKNLHLAVYPPNGRVRIAAPLKMTEDVIRVFAISKLSWIKKQQKQFEEQPRQSSRNYISGESHYFKGTRYLLRVNTTTEKDTNTHWKMGKNNRPKSWTMGRKKNEN